MSRRKRDPIRLLTQPERQALSQISRSQSAPAVKAARAKMLLLVANSRDYQEAAQAVAHRSIESDDNSLVKAFEGLWMLTEAMGR